MALRRPVYWAKGDEGVDTSGLTAFFTAQADVRLAYLFGSQARGEAGPLSDVDLAIVLDPATPSPDLRRDDLNARLMQWLHRDDVDLVLADRAPPLLRHRIVRYGICLFAREPVEATRFAVRALQSYEDTRPLRDIAYAAQQRRLASDEFGRAPAYRRVGE